MNLSFYAVFVGAALGAGVGFIVALLALLIAPDTSGWVVLGVFTVCMCIGAGFYGVMAER